MSTVETNTRILSLYEAIEGRKVDEVRYGFRPAKSAAQPAQWTATVGRYSSTAPSFDEAGHGLLSRLETEAGIQERESRSRAGNLADVLRKAG